MYVSTKADIPAEAAAAFRGLLAVGELEQALLLVYRAGGTTTEEVDLLRAQPNWPARVRATPTLARELFSVADHTFAPARFTAMTTPTLLIQGTVTLPVHAEAIDSPHAVLPDNRLLVLDGQGHDAVITTPDRYAAEVINFLLPS